MGSAGLAIAEAINVMVEASTARTPAGGSTKARLDDDNSKDDEGGFGAFGVVG